MRLFRNGRNQALRIPGGFELDGEEAIIRREGERSICTSVVVASELRFGAQKLGAGRLSRQLEAILGAIEILPLEKPADLHYASIRWDLEQHGELTGPNELAHALAWKTPW